MEHHVLRLDRRQVFMSILVLVFLVPKSISILWIRIVMRICQMILLVMMLKLKLSLFLMVLLVLFRKVVHDDLLKYEEDVDGLLKNFRRVGDELLKNRDDFL